MTQIVMPTIVPPLPKNDWLKPDEGRRPAFWISEIRFLRALSPQVSDEIRRIELKKGLNIVWSEPADPDGDENERGRGHGAGKTSFCRAIRYILGEDHFGNKFIRERVRNAPELRRAYIVAQVWIGETPWAIARPLYLGGAPFAMPNTTIDTAIVAEAGRRKHFPYESFTSALKDAVTSYWVIQHFDKEKRRPIEWGHILQPLTRDQENHLASLHAWRHEASASDSPYMFDSEKAFLMRCMLKLADDKEAKEIQSRIEQQARQNTAEASVTFYSRMLNESMNELHQSLPDVAKYISPDDDLFISAVTDAANSETERKLRLVRGEIERLQIDDLRKERETLVQDISRIKGRTEEREELLLSHKTRLEAHKKKENPTPQDVDELRQSILAKIRDRQHCGVSIEIALDECDVYKRLGITRQHRESSVETYSISVVKACEDLISGLEDELRPFREKVAELEARRKNYDTAIAGALGEETNLRKKMDDILLASDGHVQLARNAVAAVAKRKAANEVITDAGEKITKSDNYLEDIRKDTATQQQKLSNIFDTIVKAIAGSERRGVLKFTNIEINAALYRQNEVESEAFKAVKALGYDFTALVAWLNNAGHHPGFLLHDSPRESDLEASLYYPYFNFIEALAQSAPESFQYIVTTTEPPPKSMRDSPIIRMRLDASKSEGFLYKEIL